MIRLMLVDDHAIVRESLRTVLERESDIEVVGEAGDGVAALEKVRELSPDLLLTDITMPGLDGIELVRRVASECPEVKVLALSTHLDRRFVVQMLEAGALGYVNKAAGRDELLQGIRAVAAGNRYLCQECAAMLVKAPADNGTQAKLGRREIEVLKMIARGETSSAIAESLYIAPGTVEVHRRNIMRKLDLHKIAELTQYAIREGLISL
jgi:two-component system NarL family response regulator